ncbi:MAG: prepilin-type N-terminal cleavage/methylation domain-containing protein [Phycisphaerae bacterium]|nr:prepilin-type N-terminal cleavage/methylation domain-containing protein [Phycisphaerae bacterium]
MKGMSPRGFTLIELLVVISVVSVLTGILLPALGKAREQARILLGTRNQREIILGVNLFASDNDQQYPESVATIGDVSLSWNWQEPMMLTGFRARSPRLHRSMSAYLRPYIEDAGTMYCPNAPLRYKYLQDAWDAGDEWDNPQTPPVEDPVSGTYCFYWNYTGYLEDRDYLFRGPRNSAGGRGRSKLLVSDYFGYSHWRSKKSYSSCERFGAVSITEGTQLSSAYWSGASSARSDAPKIKLQAGYADGHVESFSSSDTLTMKVILRPTTGEPYPEDIAPGNFYLPRNALH